MTDKNYSYSANSTKKHQTVIEIFSSDESAKDEDEEDEIQVVKTEYNEHKVTRSTSTTCNTSTSTNNPLLTKAYLLHQPSEKWKETIQRCEELNVQFVDDTFPPNSSSIDGRKIHSKHVAQHLNLENENKIMRHLKGTPNTAKADSSNSITKIYSGSKIQPSQEENDSISTSGTIEKTIKCRCGVPAAIKTVQKDGPNFGRFFLSCGRKKSVKIKKGKTKKRKRSNNHQSDDDENDQSNEKEGDDGIMMIEDDDNVLAIDNDKDVFMKDYHDNGDSNNNLKQQCSFFQWDDNHEQAVNYSSSSRSVWMHTLSWFRYETKHGYNLTYPKGCFSPDHVKQGGMGDCWFLSALVRYII